MQSSYLLGIIVSLGLPFGSLCAQVRQARSADYLLVTDVSDVRAVWVNPAGLAVVPEASILGEVVVERLPGDDLHFAQWTVGINSRGFSVAYQRDRFDGGPSSSILRVGTGIPFSRGAIGVAVSSYGVEGPNSRDGDIGVMYGLNRIATLGLTLNHIGRATVEDVKMPLTLTGAAHLGLLRGRLQLAAQARAAETPALDDSDYDFSFAGAGRLVIPTSRPVTLLATAIFASDLTVDRLHLGISIGGRSHAVLVGSAVNRNDAVSADRVSLAGVASNPLVGR